jgi:hypothetical protein
MTALAVLLAGALSAPIDAKAQSFPITGAIMLIGGGVAVGIGNGVRAANERPPQELWDDAGWALGIANVVAGVAFAVSLGNQNPPDGALPIAIGLGTIGLSDLIMTAWAVSYAEDEPDEWQEWDDRWEEMDRSDDVRGSHPFLLSPTVARDDAGRIRFGIAVSLSPF